MKPLKANVWRTPIKTRLYSFKVYDRYKLSPDAIFAVSNYRERDQP